MEETPLLVGPAAGVHDEIAPLGPVKLHVGVPVGASEPVVPVIVPVKVMISPFEVLDCKPLTLRVGVSLATLMVIGVAATEL